MSNNPTKEQIEEGKKAIEDGKSFLREDEIIKYLTAVSDAEIEKDRVTKVAECQNKGGKYENGYCFERPKNKIIQEMLVKQTLQVFHLVQVVAMEEYVKSKNK